MYMYMYIHLYMCVCIQVCGACVFVCACVCVCVYVCVCEGVHPLKVSHGLYSGQLFCLWLMVGERSSCPAVMS